jgi:RHS repeat-associated protein
VIVNNYTGKERDAESGLDYFGARYMSGTQGRFTSVDPSMLSVKMRNPQSWNRYSYTLNNPLRYVDPTGELWTSAGGGAYSWVDQCGDGQTCYSAVAAVLTRDANELIVYGSRDSGDIQTYWPNASGNIDLRDVAADSHDANFEIKAGAAGFLSTDNAAGFFNTARAYHLTFPSDAKLFVTDAGNEGGTPLPPHQTHDHGRSVDVRYPGEDGNPLQSPTAAAGADINRVQSLVNAAKDNGFNQNYSARPKDFGTAYAAGHDSHLHLGTTRDKIAPPKK